MLYVENTKGFIMSFKTQFNRIVNDYRKLGYDYETCQRCAVSDIRNDVSHRGMLYPFNFRETKPLENCFICVSKNKINPIIS